MDEKALLKTYLDRLTLDTGWDIFIECKYGVLIPSKELDPYFAASKWHCNPYCVFVKKSHRIHSICINTKGLRWKNIATKGKAGWHTCHCGVSEYVMPVMVNNILVATIFVSGYSGPISDNMCNLLSKKISTSREEFDNVRKLSLKTYDEETINRLETYLSIAANIIKQLALKTPMIQALSKDKDIDSSKLYVLRATEYIDKNFYKKITVETIAKKCHVSSSYLQHLFLKYYGEGISSYLRKKRMERACELLCNSNRSVREIAIDCGFYDTDYFSVIFKKMFHMSPLSFRKKYKTYQQ